MALGNKQEDVPPELQEYYQAENRERVGVAWLLAIGTLIVTIGVILGLFFGVRYVYRKAHNHNPTTASNQKTSNSKTGSSKSNTPAAPTSPSPSSGTSPSPSLTPSPSPSSASSGASSSSSSSASSGSSTSSKTPSQLTNTGPGDTLAAFVIATVAGAGLYQLRLRFAPRKQ